MNRLLGRSRLFLNKNASTILTCIGGAGVILTSVLAVKATPKAMKLIERAEEEKGEELTVTETVINAAPAYIPAITAGAATIACIFGANILNKRQQAAITSAYALLDNSYREYRKKVDEIYGEDAGRKVRTGIVIDGREDNVVEIGEDEELFYDFMSERYFTAKPQRVIQAEYRLNRNLAMRDYAYLNEFYDDLGLESIESGDLLGWSTVSCIELYWQNWVDFSHEKVKIDDNLYCTIITFKQEPIIGFEDY